MPAASGKTEWEIKVSRFFRLANFPLPKIEAWPNKEGYDELDCAYLEIKLMEYLYPEFEDDTSHSSIDRAEILREKMWEKFQIEAAEEVRKELIK
jgi:hypothetical protein